MKNHYKKFIAFILIVGTIVIFSPQKAEAALSINSQMPSQTGVAADNTSLTYSFTNTSGTLLVVGVVLANPGPTITSVKYNNVTMLLAKSQISHDGATGALSALYYLLSPATGANNVVVTISASIDIISGAISFTGNDMTNPIKQSVSDKASSGTTASVVVPNTTVGNIIVDNMSQGCGIGSSSQTLTWIKEVTCYYYGDNSASSYASGTGGNVTMSYTGNENDGWAIVVAEIAAAAGGTVNTPHVIIQGKTIINGQVIIP